MNRFGMVFGLSINPVHLMFHMGLNVELFIHGSNDATEHSCAPKKSFQKVLHGKGIFC